MWYQSEARALRSTACDDERSWPGIRSSRRSQGRSIDALNPIDALNEGLWSNQQRKRRFHGDNKDDSMSTPATIPDEGIVAAKQVRRSARRACKPARAEFVEFTDEQYARQWTAHSYPTKVSANHSRIKGNPHLESPFYFPCFDGNAYDEDYLEWESKVDEFFDCNDIPPTLQAKIVVSKLTNRAKTWWNLIKHARRLEGRKDVQTWSRMKRLMRDQFIFSYFDDSSYTPQEVDHPQPTVVPLDAFKTFKQNDIDSSNLMNITSSVIGLDGDNLVEEETITAGEDIMEFIEDLRVEDCKFITREESGLSASEHVGANSKLPPKAESKFLPEVEDVKVDHEIQQSIIFSYASEEESNGSLQYGFERPNSPKELPKEDFENLKVHCGKEDDMKAYVAKVGCFEPSKHETNNESQKLSSRMEGSPFQLLNGLLRRCLTQQVLVKEIIYKGLTKVVMFDPSMSGHVFDSLWPHFLQFYNQDVEYSLSLVVCYVIHNGKISQIEHLDHLLSCVSWVVLLQHGRSDHQSGYSLPLFGVTLSQDIKASRITSGCSKQNEGFKTLSLLLGVPIPKNNLGVVLIEAFKTLKDEYKLRALELISWQWLQWLKLHFPHLLYQDPRDSASSDQVLQSNGYFDISKWLEQAGSSTMRALEILFLLKLGTRYVLIVLYLLPKVKSSITEGETWNKWLGIKCLQIKYLGYLAEIKDNSLREEYSRDDVVLKDPTKFGFNQCSHARLHNHLLKLLQEVVSDLVQRQLIRYGYNTYVVPALIPTS